MRKVKKINGYLVVRFNEREKQGYPQLGSFGVIDAEMYTGCIDTDLGAMEYEDADTLEVAVEQARGLESEQDYSGDPPVCTLCTATRPRFGTWACWSRRRYRRTSATTCARRPRQPGIRRS